jgi:hypothetical protein
MIFRQLRGTKDGNETSICEDTNDQGCGGTIMGLHMHLDTSELHLIIIYTAAVKYLGMRKNRIIMNVIWEVREMKRS